MQWAPGARVTATLGAVTLLALLMVVLTRVTSVHSTSSATRSESVCASEQLATVWAVGAILWPVVLHFFIDLSSISHTPLLFFALVWPIFLMISDLRSINHQTLENETTRGRSGMQLETNSIASITFAIGGLLMTHMGRRWAEAAVPLLSAVILFCIAFVLPRPALHPRSVEGIRVHAMQRVALVYCIGLISATVLLMISGVTRRVDRRVIFSDTTPASPAS